MNEGRDDLSGFLQPEGREGGREGGREVYNKCLNIVHVEHYQYSKHSHTCTVLHMIDTDQHSIMRLYISYGVPGGGGRQ